MDTLTDARADIWETELLSATRGGDGEAFAALYGHYQAHVFRIANLMLRDPAAAEDIVQSVFFSIWLSPPIICSGSFSSWLTFVTKNRTRDMLRARTQRAAIWNDNAAISEAPDDQAHLHLECDRVRSALKALPKAQRSLIELGFYGERSHAELAELTCLPLGTVKTRIRSGLQKLRFALAAP